MFSTVAESAPIKYNTAHGWIAHGGRDRKGQNSIVQDKTKHDRTGKMQQKTPAQDQNQTGHGRTRKTRVLPSDKNLCFECTNVHWENGLLFKIETQVCSRRDTFLPSADNCHEKLEGFAEGESWRLYLQWRQRFLRQKINNRCLGWAATVSMRKPCTFKRLDSTGFLTTRILSELKPAFSSSRSNDKCFCACFFSFEDLEGNEDDATFSWKCSMQLTSCLYLKTLSLLWHNYRFIVFIVLVYLSQ